LSCFPSHTHALQRELVAISPDEALARLRPHGGAWLLESSQALNRLGRFSFAGAAPWGRVCIRGRRLEVDVQRPPRGGTAFREETEGDPLERLRHWLPPRPTGPPPTLPFAGGAVGYFGYELAEQLDVHQLHGRDDLALPDAVWLLVDRVVAIEHETGRAFACALGFGEDAASAEAHAHANADWLEQALRVVPKPAMHAPVSSAPPRARDLDATDYAQAVESILDEIRAGNVYQACLTARADRAFGGDPWTLYQILRRLNPAPFASYLELPEVAIVGSSPERFLRVTRDGRVESRPIKGTAPRSEDPAEDAALRDQLRRSEKDRAENVMIVDLVRNDLGRVCETGSVAVPELLAIEAYASVFQLVSTVVGRLAPERDALDAVRACFPPGSMTGAPKISAMKILDRLEPVRRAVYSGALGYLDAWGSADLSVVIRTLLVQQGRAFVHAGGGVVADSKPESEYAEALEKLRPLLAALDAARETDSI